MSRARFTDEFKRDAVAQVKERGYSVAEVSDRLGISTKSLYSWIGQFSKPAKEAREVTGQAAEIRRLKRELSRVTEERDILKKATAYFAKEDERQTRLIEQAWHESGKVYGYPLPGR